MSEARGKSWKLDDEYVLHFGNINCTLEYKSLEKYPKNWKGKWIESHITKTSYYGTLYQALQGYVHQKLSSGDTGEVLSYVQSVIKEIDSVMGQIDDKYKIVKVSRGTL